MRGRTFSHCRLCGSEQMEISEELGVCRDCLLHEEKARALAGLAHDRSRKRFGLPESPPRNGIPCGQCGNDCSIPDGETGYCGIRWSHQGKVSNLVDGEALVTAYSDPHPTNCVADWVCPGGSTAGFPRYSRSPGPEVGFANLAVFYGACTFDCLFCQNWHFREMTSSLQPRMSAESLARMAGPMTSCICFFGGDPTPFIQHSISVAEISCEGKGIRRMCWETNGSMSSRWARRIGEIALETGGCVKIDLKAFDERIHRALCGTSNGQTIKNLEILAEMAPERREVPLLVVSTLMVPGYVNEDEVALISNRLADIDPSTPYSLLAFHPAYMMNDLPTTSRSQADACIKAAREAGLENVKIGNEWLLR
jgi:pyruvate formate lyase activating enzyme